MASSRASSRASMRTVCAAVGASAPPAWNAASWLISVSRLSCDWARASVTVSMVLTVTAPARAPAPTAAVPAKPSIDSALSATSDV